MSSTDKVKKRTLIHDIARHLNVSIATVSFVLNGKAKEQRISDALAEKVLRYVEEVGYKPNQLAKSLRTGKTHVIGLIIEDISNPFFATVAWLIEKKAFGRGYRIIYCSTDNNTAKTKDLISMFQERHIDGYIIAPPEGIEEEVNSLLRSNKPTVLLDRYIPSLISDYVVVDGADGTYQAARHLLEQGFENVAFVTSESRQTQMEARLQGYSKALDEAGRAKNIKRFVVNFGEGLERLVSEIYSFIKNNREYDAIIFANNILSIYGLEAIARLGLRIPEDIGVISFDDHDLFRLHSPTITAIAQPVESLAENSIDVLLRKLEQTSEAEALVDTIVLPTSLIIRGSSMRKSGR
ncbi:LacI family DNA-binding transcriptional regulator [Hymenobacter cavernae]|uniref:LacI family transcriptional regulator n=1 Tax=Hymenobacter cavernae TaxID=2044852 RepID=A0ABQ1U1V2_9BACT|nr:LacI family DNA-binding transcriptional regulator [Hymenobacter cavernae]GGF06438.1 LacI family transcriptional regulator [Hymenobacter cavernae]